MKQTSRLFFVLFILVFLTAGTFAVRAAGLALTLSPMVSDLTIDPGTTQTGLITLRSYSSVGTPPLDLKASLMDWTIDTNGKPLFSAVSPKPDSCAPWVQVDPLEVTVPDNGSTTVRYTVTVPPTAQGCYHCIIFFTTAPTPSIHAHASAELTTTIGNTIYVQVGPPVRRAKVVAMSLTGSDVQLTVQNTGSSYFRVNGVVKIADMTGNTIQQVDVPRSVVLPGTNDLRNISIDLPSPLKTGQYTATAILDYGGDALLGARINATLP